MENFQLEPMHLLARHLSEISNLQQVQASGHRCAFTGLVIQGLAYKAKDIISGNFTDWTSLRAKSEFVSIEAAKCLKETLPLPDGRTGAVRMYSYYADMDKLKVLNHNERMEALLGPKNPPFVFVVGNLYASKAQKHVIHKAVVSTSADNFFVCTEAGWVEVDMNLVNELVPLMQAWYTMPEGSKSTFFTKEEIRSGCDKVSKIEAYGIAKYFEQNNIFKKHRGSKLFELLINFLQPKTKTGNNETR